MRAEDLRLFHTFAPKSRVHDFISTLVLTMSWHDWQEGEGTRGVAPMLVEVKARLSCRYSLEQELENLKSRFVMSIFEVHTPFPPSIISCR